MKADKIAMILSLCVLGTALKSEIHMKGIDGKTRYTASIENRNVAYEFLINDIPVLSSQTDASGTITNFPINPWLLDEENTFRIRILTVEFSSVDPRDDKLCRLTVSGPKGLGMPDTTICQLVVVPSEADPVPVKDKRVSVTLGYPEPAWAHSEKIGRDSATQKNILDKYREFHHMLETKDLEGIMAFSAAKLQEYAKSLDAPNFASDHRDLFREDFDTPPGTLIGIDVQAANGLTYEYFYGDRLVSIKNDEGRSIIMYYNEEDGVTTSFPLFFYFDGTDFILIL